MLFAESGRVVKVALIGKVEIPKLVYQATRL